MHDLPDVQRVLDSLPDRVDRNLVREVVTSQLEDRQILPAFVSAMIWGYSDSGYGPTRVRWVLTGVKTGTRDAPVRSDVADSLRAAVDTVRGQGPVEGFRYMNNAGRIKDLAGAFFTKWVYFASAIISADDANARRRCQRGADLGQAGAGLVQTGGKPAHQHSPHFDPYL